MINKNHFYVDDDYGTLMAVIRKSEDYLDIQLRAPRNIKTCDILVCIVYCRQLPYCDQTYSNLTLVVSFKVISIVLILLCFADLLNESLLNIALVLKHQYSCDALKSTIRLVWFWSFAANVWQLVVKLKAHTYPWSSLRIMIKWLNTKWVRIRKLAEFIHDLRMVCWWYFIIVLNWLSSAAIKSVIASHWLL